jgi:hypothetical protein
MQRFSKYFAFGVALLYFALGVYVLVGERLAHLPKTIKVTFSAFLFLYGGFRLARIWSRSREKDGE